MARVGLVLLLVLAAVAAVSAQTYGAAFFQRQGDGSCADFVLGECQACTDNCGATRYYKCTTDGDELDCIRSDYSDCSDHDYHPEVYHRECGQLSACNIGYQQKFFVEFSVDSSSELAGYSEPEGRDSYVQMTGTSAVGQGHTGNIVYSDGTNELRFEVALNSTTYLTTAGPCNFGDSCAAGDMTYRATVKSHANETSPELQGTRVEIHTDGVVGFRNADSSSSSSFTALLGDEFNIGSDDIGMVELEAKVGGEKFILSNLAISTGARPILYFDLTNEDGRSSYEYVECHWDGGSYSSWFYYTYSFFSYSWFYPEERDVGSEEADFAREAEEAYANYYSGSPLPSATPSPSGTRTHTPTPTPMPSSSRTPSKACTPLHVDPYHSGDAEEYMHCSLDYLFGSFESFGDFYSFQSFGLFGSYAPARPTDAIWKVFGQVVDAFRL